LLVIDIDDDLAEGGELLGETDYESFIAAASAADAPLRVTDEWQAISLLYTSGTTGNPKGCVYHHRGAYLNAMGNMSTMGVTHHSRYLWTLPMFHCDGWTFTWAVTAAMGTHVCLRKVDPKLIFELIEQEDVTHMCGAPIVLNMLANAPAEIQRRATRNVEIATGGAAPPSSVIESMEAGWFHTGDLGVQHPDGYIEIKDRAKDIIISGGENVSTLEVEEVLYRHPAILEAAVVAKPDEKWGETPCAFVTLHKTDGAGEQEIIEYCREHLARFKVPKCVVFGPLPKTSTGKIQKFALRDLARESEAPAQNS